LGLLAAVTKGGIPALKKSVRLNLQEKSVWYWDNNSVQSHIFFLSSQEKKMMVWMFFVVIREVPNVLKKLKNHRPLLNLNKLIFVVFSRNGRLQHKWSHKKNPKMILNKYISLSIHVSDLCIVWFVLS
jgi:hypothetical protein